MLPPGRMSVLNETGWLAEVFQVLKLILLLSLLIARSIVPRDIEVHLVVNVPVEECCKRSQRWVVS